jgi:beta-glucanase (GH16 family)
MPDDKPEERLVPRPVERPAPPKGPLPQRSADHPVPMREDRASVLIEGAADVVAPGNMVLTPDWRVLLNENFSISNLDMEKWWTRFVYNGGTLDYLNDEWQRYREDGNHVMGGGLLKLTSLPYDAANGYWPSGAIRSKDCFDVGNGSAWYFECRCKSPAGLGVWPAFWLAGSERVPGDDSSIPWPPEMDIMEIVNNGEWGNNTTVVHCGGKGWDEWQNNTWTWVHPDFNGEFAWWQAPFDFAAGFHTFGLYYKRPDFTIYVDRKPILAGTYAWNDWQGPSPGCYVLCNLAIGGSWAGKNGVDDGAMPQSLDVDYIRVYTQVAQSTIGVNLLPT